MHYIVGTRFTVNPAFKVVRGAKDKNFTPGITYSLLHILKKDDRVYYKFKGSDNKIIEVEFYDCGEADLFISKYRNEKLPAYNSDISEFFKLD